MDSHPSAPGFLSHHPLPTDLAQSGNPPGSASGSDAPFAHQQQQQGSTAQAPGSPRQSGVSQADVDSIIRKKRKQREYKACYPCRSRKVKCDQQVPCKSCIDRHHPEYCTYHPPTEPHPPAKRVDNGASHGSIDLGSAPASTFPFDTPNVPSPQVSRNGSLTYSGEMVTLAREDLDRLVSQVQSLAKSLSEVQSSMKQITRSSTAHTSPPNGFSYSPPEASSGAQPPPQRPQADPEARHFSTEGIHASNELGETIHIGANSVPALVMALGKGQGEGPDVQDLLGKSILPIFGLDNESATYPFISLWGMPSSTITRIQDLARAIPDEVECNRFFHFYRDTAHVVYPAIADIDAFQEDLLHFMIARQSAPTPQNPMAGITERSIYGKSLFWVGLLFAALASGCQCCDLPRRQRELTSQVFVCCSFECLRLTNFFGHSTQESIQTLLVLSNVISNNMNAGVAWALLGLTIRLAQGLGLHRDCPKSTPLPVKAVKSKIWWAVIWQDSLLSITYDRASSMMSLDRPNNFPPNSTSIHGGDWSYEECMYRLCRVGLDIVRERAMPQDFHATMLRISEQRKELQDIVANAADYLKDSRCCKSMKDQLQHWALYLHMSYAMSELCRPAISPNTPVSDLSKAHRNSCIESLVNTVESFLGLHNISSYANRSWAAMQRGLSSALLLCILREPSRNRRAKDLLDKFVNCLYEITADIDPTELSAPIKRSLMALTKLNNTAPNPSTPSRSHVYPPPGATQSGATSAPTPTTAAIADAVTSGMDINGWGALLDSPGLLSGMSPLLGFSNEDSPYAVMDQIIWGQKQSPGSQGF